MKISLGCDHAGFDIKYSVIDFLKSSGYEVFDHGASSCGSCDYPDFAKAVAEDIMSGKTKRGILICGTGIGMSIAANKFPGIRAAVCWSKETAALIAQHNNANIICVGSRIADVNEICSWIKVYLNTKFEERHSTRISKIYEIEKSFSGK